VIDKYYAVYDNALMKTIAILLLPGAYLSAVHGLAELFEDAERKRHGSFAAEIVAADRFVRLRRKFDVVIVPPVRSESLGGDGGHALVAALARSAARGARVCSVCAGAFYLCAAGLADDGPVTTHWSLADRLAVSFPAVRVEADRMLIDRGNVVTSGGLSAWQDLGLYLIRGECSPEIALEVASTFLINPGDRSQLAYARTSLDLPATDGLVEKALAFIKAECGSPIGVRDVAAHCGTTVRTLLRAFDRAHADSPGNLLRQFRLERARHLLSTGRVSVKETALACGYADHAAFSRAFRSATGVSPAAYRRDFGPSVNLSSMHHTSSDTAKD